MTAISTDPVTSRRLLDRLAAGTPFGIIFGGQGTDWLEALAEVLRVHAVDIGSSVHDMERRLAPVSAQLAAAGVAFEPLAWLDGAMAGESAEVDAPVLPGTDVLHDPSVSMPGIFLAQLATLRAVRALGLDVTGAVGAAGHSQGRIAVAVLDGLDEDEALAYARLIGAATTIVARRRGLLGRTMLSVSGVSREQAEAAVDGTRVVVGLRNGRQSLVLSGPEAGIDRVAETLDAGVAEPVAARAAFHHPDLAEACELVADWSAACGLDAEVGRQLTREAIVDEVDWVADVEGLVNAGARWLLDLGPADLAARLTAREAAPNGVAVVAPATRRGLRELTLEGAAPHAPRAWSSFAPSLALLPDGSVRAETAFTRITGRSPIVLAGMTPTTVDPAIVAAAANAGFWAELAGGGQVSEAIFAGNVARLDELLEPGRTYAFNALFLDPYLWRMHVGSQRLVQRARAAGSAVDALVMSAGIPDLDEAVGLVHELRAAGIEYVVFKPGTVAQIKQVLAIADAVAPVPLVIQVEGGAAGGHHSSEDLDELIIATYGQLRKRDNVVVCVGGGIGTPEAAVRYVTGEWALDHGQPAMPLDGVLIGTAAMAALEATTSPAVKQLLVETGPDGVISGRSQLGAPIHEIDNTAARAGRLLDEVAGDAEAVAARREEIIAAINRTAKPYFGDAEAMTYAQWLGRFVELAGEPEWLDITIRDRFHAMLQRAEARLHPADRGPIPTLFADAESAIDGAAAVARLGEGYPHAVTTVLHPADVAFFVEVCRRPGKPVPFVPVVDADVRRWWRSDSLWQAHDPRFAADAVCVIPGPVAVAGITRVDEPVGELLARFETAVVDHLLANGATPEEVPGLRRTDGTTGAVSLALAAPDAVWEGRTVVNPVRRIGAEWVVVGPDRAEHPATHASLLDLGDDIAELAVPVGSTTLRLQLRAGRDVAEGAAPVVVNADDALTGLLAEMAGHRDPAAPAPWQPDLVADHAAVTAAGDPVARPVPDVLVGLTWPAVFGALSQRADVVGGVLDLVHLDHAVTLDAGLPDRATALDVSAVVRDVVDTELGRVVTVDVTLHDGGTCVATFQERFAIRGRTGRHELADPPRAGGHLAGVRDAKRRTRASATVTAPRDMAAFAEITGDHNPIHTSEAAARLAGLDGPIVHGMWLSAVAQRVVADATGRALTGWTSRFLAPVLPGDAIEVKAQRVGLVDGDELLEVIARRDGEVVLAASGRLAAPRTVYAFPGQGIQHTGMGMDGYPRSRAAREVWDRADAHTRAILGFSILEVVRENPTSLAAPGPDGQRMIHRHPDGVLFLTQFTQVAMAVLAAAQFAELREAGVVADQAMLAGHSVGEYNALAAVSGALSLEAVVEVVFQRGTVMSTLVPRDAEGRSDYRLAAIRPSQFAMPDEEVRGFIEQLSRTSGEFLEIANYNLRGSQYAIAGTVRGCELLEAEIEERRAAAGGRACFVLVPGIDVPFHSSVLRSGVDDFRGRLEELLPETMDTDRLVGRYVPNLVARPFALDDDFLAAILEVVPADRIQSVLDNRADWVGRDGELCRLILIELLAWQFASPVRWIETQDLLFADPALGGSGIQRFVEVGVGRSPTLANIAASTVKLPEVARTLGGPVEVLNVERDAAVVFATDEDPPAADAPVEAAEAPAAAAPAAPAALAAPAAPAAPAAAPGSVADLAFTAADASRLLVAWWTKVRPDQLGAADSIESLCDGVSSRRNQLLVDLGAELSLGAIDGAAEADLTTLANQVAGLARGYRPLGPVLSVTIADHLKKVLGPAGARQATIGERVTGHWGLGAGWATHVTAEVALSTRPGASIRGGDLATSVAPSAAAEVDALIDAGVMTVAARNGVTVAPPSTAETTVDAAAIAGVTGEITDALASTARHLLARLGEAEVVAGGIASDDNAEVLARVETELGPNWLGLTAPAFDANLAVLLDDRWASAREDVLRLAGGEQVEAEFAGAGSEVAAIARWFGLSDVAELAEDTAAGEWADDVAVVTGASRGSIAASIVAGLLAGGATVIATTSSLDTRRLAFFKQLYRSAARKGARLWVVPANMASFADVDALVDWVRTEQTRTLGPVTELVKPALRPTLLFPFAAGAVRGEAADAGSRAEIEARILLWSVERLVGADWGGERLHVVLPGSPNRGRFGGDGAYGEAKAALDALVTKWSSESWAERVSLVHAIIGWVRGTGLMAGNDPLVAAVEAAGVSTWSAEAMGAQLLTLCRPAMRAKAAQEPLEVDFAGGLEKLDLRSLDVEVAPPPAEAEAAPAIDALPPSPGALPQAQQLDWGTVAARPEDLVVIVGAGELGPWGSSRTRHEMEVHDELSAAGVLELAWVTGLVRWDSHAAGWYDVASGEAIAESQVHARYHDEVVERCGIRRYEDDGSMRDNTAPLLTSVFLEEDLTFTVGSEAEARAMAAADPQHTLIAPAEGGDWRVTRQAGTEIRVPRRMSMTRTAGGQIPSGFDPAAWGIPAEMIESADRVAVWNLVCTVDAFLSSGFSPEELMRWVHPARVANSQGTGMGGMTSMQSLYLDTLLGEATANDLLQEALPNVIAAHVVQSYVGSYGAMVHPVAACATTAVSIEEGADKIRLGKADVVVAGGFDDLGTEGVIGFAAMSATADTAAMTARGIDVRRLSRANDRRRAGFVESQGGGTILLARGDVAARIGLPVLGVVAYAGSFADGVHTSIPAPGLGALAAGLGGRESMLARALREVGVEADDIGVVSKHDTSTAANDPNESELHERLADALGRSEGNPLLVVSQKTLTGHAKGGAAAFQVIGLCQVLASGVVPPNRSLDCVDEALAEHPRLVWLRRPLATGPLKAGLVTSLGFGHVAGLIALVHPEAFARSLDPQAREAWESASSERIRAGRLRLARTMLGEPGYRKPAGRRVGDGHDLEAAVLIDESARLGEDGVYACR